MRQIGCCQSASSHHCFTNVYCSLNQFSFVDCYFLFKSIGLVNVSLNFRMVLFLFSDTFHLIADFIITKGKMRKKKKSFVVFVSFTFCIQTIPITAHNYFFSLSLSSISMRNVVLIELILNVLHAPFANNFRRKTMNSCIFLGSQQLLALCLR